MNLVSHSSSPLNFHTLFHRRAALSRVHFHVGKAPILSIYQLLHRQFLTGDSSNKMLHFKFLPRTSEPWSPFGPLSICVPVLTAQWIE